MSRTISLAVGIVAALLLAPAAQAAELVPRLLAPSVRTLAPAAGAQVRHDDVQLRGDRHARRAPARRRRLGSLPARQRRQPDRRLARLRRPRGHPGLAAARTPARRRGLPQRRREHERQRHAADGALGAAQAADRHAAARPRQRQPDAARTGSSAPASTSPQDRGRGWADVVVSGAVQLATLRLSGLRFETRVANLETAFANARAADRRATTRAGAAGLVAALRSHELPHVRRHPGRAQAARRPASGARAQGRLRHVLSGARDLRRRDRAQRRRRRRSSGLLHDGAPSRPRVAVCGGRDGARPDARAGADDDPYRCPAAARADRHPAGRQPRRLHLLAGSVRSRRQPARPGAERHARRGDRPAGRHLRLPAQELRRRDPRAAAALRARLGRRSEPQLRQQLGRVRLVAGRHVAGLSRSDRRARSPRPRRSGTTSARTR